MEMTIPAEAVTEKEGGEEERQALVEGYIEKTLYARMKTTATRSVQLVGNNLTGINKKLYLTLSDRIAQVAAGTLTSTVFAFPVEDVYDQVTYTKEELGVEALVENGRFTDEAVEAVRKILRSFDVGEIVRALMADCPYELYWYDKAQGGGCIIEYPRFSTNGYSVTLLNSVTFKMTVAQAYAAGPYETDPTVGQTVNTAAQTARDIADQYKDLDDYARLSAYKNAICDLVSYNSDAANNANMPYGNPWQLIWVFDGDPETNVVCEGYAKAFQYLNELSSRGIAVISPTGTLNGNNHMWNVVTMSDGKNYLVDVTNCDAGMVGYPDKLFLTGYVSGNTAEGYEVFSGGGRLQYAYSESTVYSESQKRLAAWRYLDGKPPVPVLTTASETLYEHQSVRFVYEDDGYIYDAITAQIAYQPATGEEAETVLEMAEIGSDRIWSLLPGDIGAGTFTVCFAGIRDGVSSAWSTPTVFTALDFTAYAPSYTFSSTVGYPGFQIAVKLDEDTEEVLLLDGETAACQDGIVLLSLHEQGEISCALAVQWREKTSAFGEEVTVTVAETPLGGVLHIPESTRVIEDESFRGTAIQRVCIPNSVEQIGAYAFADNPALCLVELAQPSLDETAFDGCPNTVLCTDNAAWGFQLEKAFIVK